MVREADSYRPSGKEFWALEAGRVASFEGAENRHCWSLKNQVREQVCDGMPVQRDTDNDVKGFED